MPQRWISANIPVSVKVKVEVVMSEPSAPGSGRHLGGCPRTLLATNDASSDHHPGEDGRIAGEQQAAVAHDGDVQGPYSGAVGQRGPLELELAFSFFKGRPGNSGHGLRTRGGQLVSLDEAFFQGGSRTVKLGKSRIPVGVEPDYLAEVEQGVVGGVPIGQLENLASGLVLQGVQFGPIFHIPLVFRR